VRIVVQKLIHVPQHVAFATVTDVEGWPRMTEAIRRVEVLTPGPVAPGTRFRETRLVYGREATEEMTVAEFEPPRRFVLTAFNHGTAYRVEHLLEPQGAGTRVSLAFEGRPVSLLAKLFMPLGLLCAGSMRRQLEADLDGLEREALRRAGSAPVA
jgi:hypothetical protein